MNAMLPLLLSGLLLGITGIPLQTAAVMAESKASGLSGVAALQVTLDASRRYVLEVEGPEGAPFVARYFSVEVGRQVTPGSTGNHDGSFEGSTPYQQDLEPSAPNLLFWRYSIVVSPQTDVEMAVRVVDAGPR